MDTKIRQLLADEESMLSNMETLGLEDPRSPLDISSLPLKESRFKRPALTNLVTSDLPVYRQ